MGNKITAMERGMQRRTELLLGKDNLEKLQSARVLIFGIGGVGSWCGWLPSAGGCSWSRRRGRCPRW